MTDNNTKKRKSSEVNGVGSPVDGGMGESEPVPQLLQELAVMPATVPPAPPSLVKGVDQKYSFFWTETTVHKVPFVLKLATAQPNGCHFCETPSSFFSVKEAVPLYTLFVEMIQLVPRKCFMWTSAPSQTHFVVQTREIVEVTPGVHYTRRTIYSYHLAEGFRFKNFIQFLNFLRDPQMFDKTPFRMSISRDFLVGIEPNPGEDRDYIEDDFKLYNGYDSEEERNFIVYANEQYQALMEDGQPRVLNGLPYPPLPTWGDEFKDRDLKPASGKSKFNRNTRPEHNIPLKKPRKDDVKNFDWWKALRKKSEQKQRRAMRVQTRGTKNHSLIMNALDEAKQQELGNLDAKNEQIADLKEELKDLKDDLDAHGGEPSESVHLAAPPQTPMPGEVKLEDDVPFAPTAARDDTQPYSLNFKVEAPLNDLPKKYQIKIRNFELFHPMMYVSTMCKVMFVLAVIYWACLSYYVLMNFRLDSGTWLAFFIILHFLLCLSFLISRAIVRKIKIVYKFSEFERFNQPTDRRPDSHALAEVKHKDPMYGTVACDLKVTWKFRPHVWFFQWSSLILLAKKKVSNYDRLFVSMEAIAQATNYRTMPVGLNESDVIDRVNHNLAALHSINIDKYEYMRSTGALGNSALVSAAYYRFTEGKRVKKHRFLYPKTKV